MMPVMNHGLSQLVGALDCLLLGNLPLGLPVTVGQSMGMVECFGPQWCCSKNPAKVLKWGADANSF